jgi:hypothetical protein
VQYISLTAHKLLPSLFAQRFRTLVRGGGLSRCGSATFA